MQFAKTILKATLVAAALATAGLTQAKDLTIGLVLSVSGPFADYGKQIKHGIDVYMAEHGDTVAGRKVKLIVKDDTGMAPQVAKRVAQELLVNDKVDILAGFDLTPNAFSAAPLATPSIGSPSQPRMNAGVSTRPSAVEMPSVNSGVTVSPMPLLFTYACAFFAVLRGSRA